MGHTRDAVLPGPLRFSSSDQEVPATEKEYAGGSSASGPDEKTTALSEGDQRHDWFGNLLADLIPVPGNGVPPVSVQVEAQGVKLDCIPLAQTGAHLLEQPGFQWHRSPKTPIRREARLEDVLIVHPSRSLGPAPRLQHRLKKAVRAAHPFRGVIKPGFLVQPDSLNTGE